MLRTRLWMGAVLIALAVGVLVLDTRWQPWYPCLFALIILASLIACAELVHLVGPNLRPVSRLCYASVTAVTVANWPAHLGLPGDPWTWIGAAFAGTVLATFLVEMAVFEAPGQSVSRMALTVFTTAYLGLLPCFLTQLRWLGEHSGLALALSIFVPKMCDTGAYFTGRALGRHRMTPTLSPKKTWEGAAGGLTAAVLTAIAIDCMGPVFPGIAWTIGFGLTVGIMGMLGDLAESLIKRDVQHKDASQVMPGFGGVLDVVDSIIFAAPVAYLWLR
jgi:phosphatidate cytidylyltransferase